MAPTSSASFGQSTPTSDICTLCKTNLFSGWSIAIIRPCNHRFHLYCITRQLALEPTEKTRPICPIDSQPLTQLAFPPPQQDWPALLCRHASSGELAKVREILSLGAQVTIDVTSEDSALRAALGKGHLDVARELITHCVTKTEEFDTLLEDCEAKSSRLIFFNCLQIVAELGHAHAQERLGKVYLCGLYGVRKNDSKARHWLERAVAKGRTELICCLAHMVGFGHGGKKDLPRVVELLEAGARQEDPASLFVLGDLCLSGNFSLVRKDVVRARVLFEKALATGYNRAVVPLGRMLFDGIGGQEESARARTLIQNLCARNDQFGQLFMGDLYFWGIHVPQQNIQVAKNWYEKSARQGNDYAKVSLSVLVRDMDSKLADTLLKEVLTDKYEHQNGRTIIQNRLAGMYTPVNRETDPDNFSKWQLEHARQSKLLNKVLDMINRPLQHPTASVNRKHRKRAGNRRPSSNLAAKKKRQAYSEPTIIKVEPAENHVFTPKHRIDNRSPLWVADAVIKRETDGINTVAKTDFTQAGVPPDRKLRQQINEAIEHYKGLDNDQREHYLDERMCSKVHNGSIVPQLKGQKEVVARRPIKQWELLGHYAGIHYSEQSYREGIKVLKSTRSNIDRYSIEVAQNHLISGFRAGNITSLINAYTDYQPDESRTTRNKRHQLVENVSFLRHSTGQGKHIVFVIAILPIKAGCQLWLDYGEEYWQGIREPIQVSDEVPPSPEVGDSTITRRSNIPGNPNPPTLTG